MKNFWLDRKKEKEEREKKEKIVYPKNFWKHILKSKKKS